MNFSRRLAAAAAGLLCLAAAVVSMTDVNPTTAAPRQIASSASQFTTTAVADTYTRSDSPASNYGTAARWFVQGSTGHLRHAFVKFNVAVPAGEHVAAVHLDAYADSGGASSCPGPDVYGTTSSWTETNLTWNNEPPRGPVLAHATCPYAASTWVDFDVTTGVPASGGTVSFRLETTATHGLGFLSRENSAGHAPYLRVTTAPDATSTPTPTPTPAPTPTATPSPTLTPTLTATPTPTPTSSATPSPTSGSTPSTDDITVAAVGDANGSGQSSTTTASGLNASSLTAAQGSLAAILFLGDHQYTYGDCAGLVNDFDQAGWGSVWSKVLDVAGPTHDWSSATDLANYTDHSGGTCPGQTSGKNLATATVGHPNGPNENYVIDLGAWRVVAMSSGLWRFDAPAANAATTWLDDALTAADTAGDHVVVMWHQPYWTSATAEHPATESDAEFPWMQVLARHHVRLVLSGHQHGYERFYPQDPLSQGSGAADSTRDDANGIQSFTIGTGGIGFYAFSTIAPNSAVHQSDTYGWEKFVLHPDGTYSWQFVRTSGGSFTDSGSR
jgi:hypothetical protein